jgi:hypothetical protein
MSAAGAGSAADDSVGKAQKNAHILKKYLDMSDVEFAALSSETRRLAWFDVLKVDKPACASGKNMTTKLETFRKIYQENPWIARDGDAWIRNLVRDGKLTCAACVGSDSVLGSFSIETGKAARHGSIAKHKKNVADIAARTQLPVAARSELRKRRLLESAAAAAAAPPPGKRARALSAGRAH